MRKRTAAWAPARQAALPGVPDPAGGVGPGPGGLVLPEPALPGEAAVTSRRGPFGYALLAVLWAVLAGVAALPWLVLGWAGGLVSWFLAAAIVLAVTGHYPRPRRRRQVIRSGPGSVNIQAGRDVLLPYDGRPDGDEQA